MFKKTIQSLAFLCCMAALLPSGLQASCQQFHGNLPLFYGEKEPGCMHHALIPCKEDPAHCCFSVICNDQRTYQFDLTSYLDENKKHCPKVVFTGHDVRCEAQD